MVCGRVSWRTLRARSWAGAGALEVVNTSQRSGGSALACQALRKGRDRSRSPCYLSRSDYSALAIDPLAMLWTLPTWQMRRGSAIRRPAEGLLSTAANRQSCERFGSGTRSWQSVVIGTDHIWLTVEPQARGPHCDSASINIQLECSLELHVELRAIALAPNRTLPD